MKRFAFLLLCITSIAARAQSDASGAHHNSIKINVAALAALTFQPAREFSTGTYSNGMITGGVGRPQRFKLFGESSATQFFLGYDQKYFLSPTKRTSKTGMYLGPFVSYKYRSIKTEVTGALFARQDETFYTRYSRISGGLVVGRQYISGKGFVVDTYLGLGQGYIFGLKETQQGYENLTRERLDIRVGLLVGGLLN